MMAPPEIEQIHPADAPSEPHAKPLLDGIPRPERARVVRGVVVACVFAAVVLAGFALYGDLRGLVRDARRFAPSAIALGCFLAAGNFALRVLRWQYYLRRVGLAVPLGESTIVFLSGFAMSVTPGKLGELFKAVLLYEARRIPIARTAPIVVAERVTDLIAMVLLSAVGSLAFDHGVIVAAVGALAAAALVGACAYRPFGEALLRVVDKIPVASRLGPKLREAHAALGSLLRPEPLLVATSMALVAWGLECGSLYAIAQGFPDVELSWNAATFAFAASTLVGAMAMLPGGLGLTEAGMTGLLEKLGGRAMTPTVATATTLWVRLATLWFAVGVGVIALALHHAMQRRLSRGTSYVTMN